MPPTNCTEQCNFCTSSGKLVKIKSVLKKIIINFALRNCRYIFGNEKTEILNSVPLAHPVYFIPLMKQYL